MTTKIQFIKGLTETSIPKVQLTRSRDGSTGTATFFFKNSILLDKTLVKKGEITGMYLIDKTGVIETRNVKVIYKDGKPKFIKSIYIMTNRKSWTRFLQFMETYSREHELIFTKAID